MTQVKVEPNLDFNFDQEESNKSKSKSKLRKLGQTTNTKTIKAPGSATERVAQACDRCRAKKTKCDGKNPCSSCSNVGLECIVSDKLSRRAFPKGYTETLEIRIRQLEAENKKLTAIIDMRDEQVGIILGNGDDKNISIKQENQQITLNNLSKLQNQYGNDSNLDISDDDDEKFHHEGCPCGCSNPHAVHERPVSVSGSLLNDNGPLSIAGSVNLSDDEDQASLLSIDDFSSINGINQKQSFRFNQDSIPAPGAWQAATAIAQMQKKNIDPQRQLNLENKQQLLTSLVAVSIPRSAEETLFIPTLLARICQAYGYSSKPAILTANTMASLKENIIIPKHPSKKNYGALLSLIMNRDDIIRLDDNEANFFITQILDLPSKIDLDQFITIYLQDWGNTLPILDKNVLLKNYDKLSQILLGQPYLHDPAINLQNYDSIEKSGAIIILVVAMSLLSSKYSRLSPKNLDGERYIQYLNHYHYLILEFIKPNCIITKSCSIQSLQILSLALQYFLAIGDIATCYELRGRLITMAQQLRLHRCPAAVLGIGDTDDSIEVQNFMQGERRILFWCVYCLDIYSSLNLGVPRLLKDFEIECAMPFAGKNDNDDDENVNILILNNTKLSIHGKVSKFALSIMNYSKVLGNIVDSIYTRYENEETLTKAIQREHTLDCWRRDLPSELKFNLDLNGFTLSENQNFNDNSIWMKYSRQQLTLIFIYYHAKILIYLPIISKYGNHHNVGLSEKVKLTKGEVDLRNVTSSVAMIQQSSIQMLEVLHSICKNFTTNILPIPINTVREQARFALLVAKGTLDYTKGGPLFQYLKSLLLDTINFLNSEISYEIPGSLTKKSIKLFEWSILSILGLNLNKSIISGKKRNPANQPITKTAVARDPYNQNIEISNSQFSKNQRNPSPFRGNITQIGDNSIDEINDISQLPTIQFLSTAKIPSKSQSQQHIQPSNDANNNDGSNSDENDYLDSILSFDPFKVQVDRQMLSEFTADGSLGLGPYLEMNNNMTINSNMDLFDGDYNISPQVDNFHLQPQTNQNDWQY